MAKRQGQVEFVAVENLVPAPYNPREITAKAFEGLLASVKRWGLPQPLVVNRRNMVVVSGHQRLKAAKQLGFSTVPVVFVDLADGDEKALNVSLNSPQITGYFTDELEGLLAEVEAQIPAVDFAALKLDDLTMFEATDDDIELPVNDNYVERGGQSSASKVASDAVIRLRCAETDRDEVLAIVRSALSETSLDFDII